MQQLWRLTVAEIRLTLRSKTCLLLGALAVALSLLSSLNLLLLLFIIITALRRDERVGLGEIVAGLPYASGKLYLARSLAVFCLLIGMWPLMVGVIVGVTGTAEWLLPEAQLALLTLKYLITCMTAIGFVFLASTVTRSTGRLYLIVGASWAVEFIFAINIRYFPPWSLLFALGHGVMLPSVPSVALGYFQQQGLLPALAVFQGTLAIWLLLGAVAWQIKKRTEPRLGTKRLLAFALLTAVVGLAAGSAVVRELKERNNGYRLALHGNQPRVIGAANGALPVSPDLVAYQLNLNLQTATHTLEGTANLKLKWIDPAAQFLVFTLRPYFTVREVELAGRNEPLRWQRAGSRLIVRVPEYCEPRKAVTMKIRYSGIVWEWSSGPMVRPNGPINLITPTFSLLRSGYAWYPVPGAEPLFTREPYQDPWSTKIKTVPWARRVQHAPVPFEMTVKLDVDSTVVSNLELDGLKLLTGKYKKQYCFYSRQGRDVFLITGPYHHEKKVFPKRGGWLDVYCFRQHHLKLNRVWDSLAEPYRFYEAIFQPNHAATGDDTPVVKAGTVVETPSFFSFTEDGCMTKDLFLTDTVLLTEDYFRVGNRSLALVAEMQANKRDLAILQRWWQEDLTRYSWDCDGDIGEGLMLYCYTLGLEKRWGRGFYEAVKANLRNNSNFMAFTLPEVTGGPLVRDVFTIMDALRGSGSDDSAIKQMIGQLYRLYVCQGRIKPSDFTKEVEMTLAQGEHHIARAMEIRRRLRRLEREVRNQERRRIKSKYSMLTTIVFNQEEWVP
jgi:hypothetical protein